MSSSPWCTSVTTDGVVFRLPDPDHDLRDVHLWHDLHLPDLPDLPHALTAVSRGWRLRWPLPPASRIEYQFTAHHPAFGADRAFLLDPGNPRTVDGPFGRKSCLPLPGSRARGAARRGARRARATGGSAPRAGSIGAWTTAPPAPGPAATMRRSAASAPMRTTVGQAGWACSASARACAGSAAYPATRSRMALSLIHI